ncbi:hypothetical protein BCR43DRAFT_187577 [Syncephalastrum racemosum]|uniref:Uncharacterized protein n=1 Tax=Syncephalastrum racemosum TaxID=13706 RepID=A0A1X2HQN0_SYNRA|nr:hypothetical protein BCR43DRAFT_187577 [Syncephalastrum racemosum]
MNKDISHVQVPRMAKRRKSSAATAAFIAVAIFAASLETVVVVRGKAMESPVVSVIRIVAFSVTGAATAFARAGIARQAA